MLNFWDSSKSDQTCSLERSFSISLNLLFLESINKTLSLISFSLDSKFNKAIFNIYNEDLVFFEELLKTEPSENKIIIKSDQEASIDKEGVCVTQARV